MAYNTISSEGLKARINKMIIATDEARENVENLHVFISVGNNKKTGALVPSISLRPVIDCKNCAICSRNCYDLRHDTIFKEVIETRAQNAAIWEADPARYFDEISAACRFFFFFRWHIGGDIVNDEYLAGMCKVARENKRCNFLAFTKCFDIVNKYIETGHEIPENLQIIFSAWPGQKMDNKFNFPVSSPRLPDGSTGTPDGYTVYKCTGNCSECAAAGCNCWTLKKFEAVEFEAH